MNRERTVRLLNVTTLFVLLIVVGSAAAVVVNPPEREPDTEFYILSGDGSGEPAAGGYTDRIRSENGSIYVGIEHGLETAQQYTVVVQLQRMDLTENRTEVTGRENAVSFPVRADPGARTLRRVETNRAPGGQYSRIAFLLYLDSVPPDPSIRNAHRSTYVWIGPRTDTE